MAFTLDPLPYDFSALEPFIDAQTMQIHHDKHHQTYVDKLNDALKDSPELAEKPIEDLIKNLNSVSENIKTAVRNHGGGHFNHTFFWKIMRPGKENNVPEGTLAEAINKKFTDFENFKKDFSAAAAGRFGSGWAWLVVNPSGELEILSTQNQDNPLMENLGTPILGLDVWEHAYYLKYQNRRPEYIEAWFNVVNWQQAEENYKNALK